MSWQMMHGDALALMRELAPGSVDLVLTDPPYSSGGAFRSDRSGSASARYLTSGSGALDRLPDFAGDNRTERGLLLWSALWLGEAWRAAKTGAALAVFADWRSLPTVSDAIQAGGWSWRGVGVWTKPQHTTRPTAAGLWNDTEFILWGSKGPRTPGASLPGSWLTPAPTSANRQHPTEKPQAVLRDLVRLAPHDGLVLDPFAGSGSAGVAALLEGRRYIGMELTEAYAGRAAERLRNCEVSGADVSPDGLFAAIEEPENGGS